ncbi:MAG: hypothetical protein KatS3mg028_0447 [Bacteroidia bacterium]|nr:MAG: hypothetical protein KatS3mg028_0447 [Bacteroidia bacterium]
MPKTPPAVAAYTIGTCASVPKYTLCKPTHPKGNGKARAAATLLFFLLEQ